MPLVFFLTQRTLHLHVKSLGNFAHSTSSLVCALFNFDLSVSVRLFPVQIHVEQFYCVHFCRQKGKMIAKLLNLLLSCAPVQRNIVILGYTDRPVFLTSSRVLPNASTDFVHYDLLLKKIPIIKALE